MFGKKRGTPAKIISILAALALVLSWLCACGNNTAESSENTSTSVTENMEEATAVTADEAAEETEEPSLSPIEAIDEGTVPNDLLGDALNVFSDIEFPENYTVYAAEYLVMCEGADFYFYTLYLTAEGDPEEIITYISNLASDSSEENIAQNINYYNNDGGVGIDGVLTGTDVELNCKVIPTEEDVYDYDYVEGCDIWLEAVVHDNGEVYNELFENCYNLSSLEALSAYVDLSVITGRMSVYVRASKGNAQVDAVYNVENLSDVVAEMLAEMDYLGINEDSTMMNLYDYGDISTSLYFDYENNAVSIFQNQADASVSCGDYVYERSEIEELGFVADDENVGTYTYSDDENGVWVNINIADLGAEGDEIIFYRDQSVLNLVMWYYPSEQSIQVQVDNDDTMAKYLYSMTDGSVSEAYSSRDTVETVFMEALEIDEAENIYQEPIDIFDGYIEDVFGMSASELFNIAAA